MHRRTNNFNYRDIIVSSDHKITRVLLPILGIATSLGLSTLLPSQSAYATTDSAIRITVGEPSSYPVLRPTSTTNGYASYSVPVDIDVYGAEDFSIFIRRADDAGDNTAGSENLVGTGTTSSGANGSTSNGATTHYIAPLSSTDAGITLGDFKASSTSVWGYRWGYSSYSDNDIPARDIINPTTIARPTINPTLSTNYYGIKADGGETKLANPATMDATDIDKQGVYNTSSTTKNASGRLLLEFGASVTEDLPSDTYTGHVAISVIATPHKITLLSPQLVYMQDMDPEICGDTPTPKGPSDGTTATNTINARYATYNSALATDYSLSTSGEYHIGTTSDDISGTISYDEEVTEEWLGQNIFNQSEPIDYVPETTLIDRRDNKAYLVRKLADGNCWMSQNLELDFLTTEGGYVAHDEAGKSLVDGNYIGVLAASTIEFTNNDTDLPNEDEWTPGSVSIPTYATILSTTKDASDNAYGWKDDGTDGLRSYSYAVSEAGWAFSNQAGGSSATGPQTNRRGNLYNFTAATLGSFTDANTTGNATMSICPKGWQLPVNDDTLNSENTTDKSFSYLLRKIYQIPAMLDGGDQGTTDFVSVQKAPLNFIRSGLYDRSVGGVFRMATHGRWWSSTATTDGYARNLATYTGYVNSEHNNQRGLGSSVRCVAK